MELRHPACQSTPDKRDQGHAPSLASKLSPIEGEPSEARETARGGDARVRGSRNICGPRDHACRGRTQRMMAEVIRVPSSRLIDF